MTPPPAPGAGLDHLAAGLGSSLLAAGALAGAVACLVPGRSRAVLPRLRAAGPRTDRAGRRDVGQVHGVSAGGHAARVGAAVGVLATAYLAVAVLVSSGRGGSALDPAFGPLRPAALLGSASRHLTAVGAPGAAPALVLAGLVALRARRRTRRAAGRGARRRSVVDGVLVLAAELRAGTPALAALQSAAESAPGLGTPAAVGLLGGDVAGALRAAGRAPGADGLSWLAAAWTVSAEMGAALAETVEELVDILRAEDLAREETESALAATRATARLLCVLPAAGLGLGSVIGGHPWRVLTSTSWGPALAVAAALLAGAGLEWVERLAASAENPGGAGRGQL